jgi:hypothetical protein
MPLSPESDESDLCKCCLPAFAGKLDFGCVSATSATDLPMLCLTGVARDLAQLWLGSERIPG